MMDMLSMFGNLDNRNDKLSTGFQVRVFGTVLVIFLFYFRSSPFIYSFLKISIYVLDTEQRNISIW